MKLKEFRRAMVKNVFSTEEARVVCFRDKPAVLNLQLHQWKKNGDLIALKRGLYMFADAKVSAAEIARHLYFPCYFSLEYALSIFGILPEAVFEYTLVTLKATRRFETPAGIFVYQTLKKSAFIGFDAETLMADKEKALVDYFYLHGAELKPEDSFWEESRLEAHATAIDFKKVFSYAKLFQSDRLSFLLHHFYTYAKSHQVGS